jgi:hypothetical protein
MSAARQKQTRPKQIRRKGAFFSASGFAAEGKEAKDDELGRKREFLARVSRSLGALSMCEEKKKTLNGTLRSRTNNLLLAISCSVFLRNSF